MLTAFRAEVEVFTSPEPIDQAIFMLAEKKDDDDRTLKGKERFFPDKKDNRCSLDIPHLFLFSYASRAH